MPNLMLERSPDRRVRGSTQSKIVIPARWSVEPTLGAAVHNGSRPVRTLVNKKAKEGVR